MAYLRTTHKEQKKTHTSRSTATLPTTSLSKGVDTKNCPMGTTFLRLNRGHADFTPVTKYK